MSHLNAIKAAANHIELNAAVEDAALALNCELDSSMSYAEQAEFFKEEAASPRNQDDAPSLLAMAEILLAAEARWFEIEG